MIPSLFSKGLSEALLTIVVNKWIKRFNGLEEPNVLYWELKKALEWWTISRVYDLEFYKFEESSNTMPIFYSKTRPLSVILGTALLMNILKSILHSIRHAQIESKCLTIHLELHPHQIRDIYSAYKLYDKYARRSQTCGY